MSGGFRNQLLTRLIVANSIINRNGMFFYSGTPANGNLIFSAGVATAGTDKFNNAYLAGATSYLNLGGSMFATQISAGFLFLLQAPSPAGPYTANGEINIGGGPTMQFSPGSSASYAFNPSVPLTTGKQILDTSAGPTAITSALLEVHGAIQTTALNSIIANGNLQSQLGDIIASAGNVLINAIGKGLRVKEGSGAKMGTALLAGGTAVVNNTNVTAASRILLTAQDNLSTGALRTSARTAGTSFTITSNNAADSGVVAWFILEPA